MLPLFLSPPPPKKKRTNSSNKASVPMIETPKLLFYRDIQNWYSKFVRVLLTTIVKASFNLWLIALRELDALLYFSLFQLLTLFLFSCVVYINSSTFKIGFPITKKAPSVYEQAPLYLFSKFFLRHQFLVFFGFVLLFFQCLLFCFLNFHAREKKVHTKSQCPFMTKISVLCFWASSEISAWWGKSNHGAWLMSDFSCFPGPAQARYLYRFEHCIALWHFT